MLACVLALQGNAATATTLPQSTTDDTAKTPNSFPLSSAKALFEAGDYHLAGDAFAALYEAQPDEATLAWVVRSYVTAYTRIHPLLRESQEYAPLEAKALKWARLGADHGIGSATHNLAALLQTLGNQEEAIATYQRAWALKVPESAYILADLYRNGQGLPHDPKRALELDEAAAQLGFAPAAERATDALLRALASSADRDEANALATRIRAISPDNPRLDELLENRNWLFDRLSRPVTVLATNATPFNIDFTFGNGDYVDPGMPWKLFAVKHAKDFDGLTLDDSSSTVPAFASGETDAQGHALPTPAQATQAWKHASAGDALVLLGISHRILLRPETRDGGTVWVPDLPPDGNLLR